MNEKINHYQWLEINFEKFLINIGLDHPHDYNGLITADGDKCYGYRSEWEKNNIPFHHGVAIYLLTNISPFSKEVRDTKKGWVAPKEWVIQNYNNFKQYLPN